MQHSACVNDVERGRAYAIRVTWRVPSALSELENVGRGERDVTQSECNHLPLGITEACQAEIDGQHSRSFELVRHLDQVLPRTASGNENVNRVVPVRTRAGHEPA